MDALRRAGFRKAWAYFLLYLFLKAWKAPVAWVARRFFDTGIACFRAGSRDTLSIMCTCFASPSRDPDANRFDGEKLRVKLTAEPPNRFLVLGRGFHWINEYPFNPEHMLPCLAKCLTIRFPAATC